MNRSVLFSCSITTAFLLLGLIFSKQAVSEPFCYIDLSDGEMMNLENICGSEPSDPQSPQSGVWDERSRADMAASNVTPEDIQEMQSMASQNPDAAAERLKDILCSRTSDNECSISVADIYINIGSN